MFFKPVQFWNASVTTITVCLWLTSRNVTYFSGQPLNAHSSIFWQAAGTCSDRRPDWANAPSPRVTTLSGSVIFVRLVHLLKA